MTTTSRVLVALAFALSLSLSPACGSKVVDELDGLTEKMCACTDSECANAAHKEVKEWSERNAAAQGRRKDRDKIHELLEKSNTCMKNVLLGKKGDAKADEGSVKPAAKGAGKK